MDAQITQFGDDGERRIHPASHSHMPDMTLSVEPVEHPERDQHNAWPKHRPVEDASGVSTAMMMRRAREKSEIERAGRSE